MICLLLLVQAHRAAAANFEGPFTLRQALTFYVVNEQAVDFTLKLHWHDEAQIYADRPLLIRVFDPAENLIVRREEMSARLSAPPIPQQQVELPVKASGPGIYQVAITGFGGELHFSTVPELPFGVFGHPRLVGRNNQFQSAYIYLPPGLDQLPVRCEETITEFTLRDQQGQIRLNLQGANPAAQAQLPSGVDRVWLLSIKAPASYRLDFAGLPIILCPDDRTARMIRASVDVLADGTICFHKFQVRAQQVLEHYRAMNPVAFTVRPPQLDQLANLWVREPARNELLLGPYGVYGALPATMREQNLDPASPWFGTINAWRDSGGRNRSENPWASYVRLGLSRVAEPVAVFAAVHSIQEPFNPLFRDQGLRNRAIIAALQELMLLREYEMPDAAVPDNYFGGERAFTFSSFLRAYPLLVRDCPADVRSVWTEGLQRYVDHESISQVALTANQWSATIKGLQHFADGTGSQIYKDIVQRHVHWLLTRNQWDYGQQPAGYFDESGPDATYVGITLHHLAWVYEQWKRDRDLAPLAAPVLLGSLRRCYELFNHTVAPQPDGTIIGASSFNVRTPLDWTQVQYGGGLAMLADDLAEAAPLATRVWPVERRIARTAAQAAALQQIVRDRLHYIDPAEFTTHKAAIAAGPDLFFAIWEHFAKSHQNAQLPMVARNEFVRNFGDEFFCVRRPGYYAFLYAGNRVPEWQKDQRPIDPRRQHPRNGGGLCMLWSPMFGSSLLAQNWSAYSAHSIIAEHPRGSQREADWEDYWSISARFNVDSALATITGRLRDQPIEFTREYRFPETGIECDLSLNALHAAEYRAMWECFPLPAEERTRLLVTLLDARGQPLQQQAAEASAIALVNSTREAHLIIFAQPRACEIGMDHGTDNYGKRHVFRRVLAALPRHWDQDQKQTIRWTARVTSTDRISETVRAAIAQMNR